MVEKHHSILSKPWEYRINKFHYDCSSEDYLEHFIDIQFVKEDTVHNLRFIGPKQLKIEEGFPQPTAGFVILDISDRYLEDINIWVADFEGSHGSVSFYAKYVVEII